MAIAHGACTGVPNGLSTHTRQSPISSRKRSTTIVRSSGTTPVASACSLTYCSRLRAANSSRPWSSRGRRSRAASSETLRSSRTNAPSARPSSSGRPGRSPCQNGILPGSPGAGVTVTRSNVMSSIRHVEAPSTNVSPGRLS